MRFLFTAALSLCFLFCSAQPAIVLVDKIEGFTRPVDITGAGDGSNRLFVVEQPGRIRVIDQTTGMIQGADFIDLRSIVRDAGNEQGLLGLAFHPDFQNNGYFFVNFTSNGIVTPNRGETVIARYTATGANLDAVEIGSQSILLSVAQPFSNHNGGDLAFGADGYLYIGTGDGGSGGDPQDNGQDPQSLLGKMLRIDVDVADETTPYGIPADNPFVGNSNVLDEIWALGLRNPWRISFDRATNDLWVADVGQVAREEIDFQPASSTGGENYGWDCREGTTDYPATGNSPGSASSLCGNGSVYTDPIFDYPRSSATGGFSITGGFVYRGTQADDLLGHYVCADYLSSNFFLITPDTGSGRSLVVQRNLPIGSISTFGEDDAGNLYVADLFEGNIYRITSDMIPVSVATIRSSADGPRIFPNPAYRDFTVSIPELQQSGTVNVRVFSFGGKLVYQKMHLEDGGPIEGNYVLPEVPSGVYQVLITYDKETFVRKLVVE
jgi:glucose/arabinose dehydrogenase